MYGYGTLVEGTTLLVTTQGIFALYQVPGVTSPLTGGVSGSPQPAPTSTVTSSTSALSELRTLCSQEAQPRTSERQMRGMSETPRTLYDVCNDE